MKENQFGNNLIFLNLFFIFIIAINVKIRQGKKDINKLLLSVYRLEKTTVIITKNCVIITFLIKLYMHGWDLITKPDKKPSINSGMRFFVVN